VSPAEVGELTPQQLEECREFAEKKGVVFSDV
jgi:hypothetical protein